ncbi:MAG TPA: Gfo/Idh/MocA family oxidoreductase [Bacteroidales bacterium]|nr:Gfo/Idh/MocA family oxidoreductase [Bacteroidales bacterium]
MKLNRRNFIQKATVSAAGLGVFFIVPSEIWNQSVAPSDKINLALIGCNSQGFWDLKCHLDFGDSTCVALCDVDSKVLNERAEEIRRDYNTTPKIYKDFRKMLEQKDIGAVIIGTPDHWHCLHLVYACQAGKDVYVEKPMANTIAECNIMVKAADYYNRVVQVGQQQRSGYVFQESMKMIKDGSIGKLRKVNIWGNFNYGTGTEIVADSSVPEGVDYDMWLGPAPLRPFNRSRFHGSWRHFWDYGGGLMSDWGVHLLDMGLWAKDLVEAPKKVMTYAANSSSEKKMRDTFDTMTVVYPKEDYVINWDMTAGVQQGTYEKLYGLAFIGEKATIVTDRNSYHVYPEWDDNIKAVKTEAKSYTDGKESHREHARNFLDCIKSRNKPVCPPELGRVAALHAHIPNICARTDEPVLFWDDVNSRFLNSEKANTYIKPEYRAPWTFPTI